MLVNLTPHAVVAEHDDGTSRTYPPSGALARCAVTRAQIGVVDGVPVYRATFGAVEGLPPPADGTHYIVSRLVAEASRDRADLLVPDDTVRDAEGKIVGCRAFAAVGQ